MQVNIHPVERGLSIAAAAAAIRLSKYFSWKVRLPLLVVGGAYAARGLTGHSRVYDMLEGSTQRRKRLKDMAAVVQGPVRVRGVATINRSMEEVNKDLSDKRLLEEVLRHLPAVQAINFGAEDFSVGFRQGVTLTFATKTEQIGPYHYLIHGRERETLTFELRVKLTAQSTGRTRVQVDFGTKPPLGKLGELISQPMTPFLNKILTDFLDMFKQRTETGEISTITGQPRGGQTREVPTLPEEGRQPEEEDSRYATGGV